jgi:hypothetical protein
VLAQPAGVDQLRDLGAGRQLPGGGAAAGPHVRGGLLRRAGAGVGQVCKPLENDRFRLEAAGMDDDLDAVVVADGDPRVLGAGERERLRGAVDREAALTDLGAHGAPACVTLGVSEADLHRGRGEVGIRAVAPEHPHQAVARRRPLVTLDRGIDEQRRRVDVVRDVNGPDAGVARPAADRGPHAGDGVDGEGHVRQRGLDLARPLHPDGLAPCVGLVVASIAVVEGEGDDRHRARHVQPAALAAHAFQFHPRDLAAYRAWVDGVGHRPALARRQRHRDQGTRGVRVAHERLGEAGLAADRLPHAVADGRVVLVARVVDHDGVRGAGRKPPAHDGRALDGRAVRALHAPLCSASVEHRQIERAQSLGVRQRVDGDDLAAGDGEAHDRERPALGRDDDAGDTIDQRGADVRGELGEPGRAASHVLGAVDDERALALVGAQHDVGVQDGDQAFEVAVAGGGEERVDHAALLAQVRIR